MLPALTLTLCGNIGTPCTCSHKGLWLGQEAFTTIVKNNNAVYNLHITCNSVGEGGFRHHRFNLRNTNLNVNM